MSEQLLFGEMLIRLGVVSHRQVEEALERQRKSGERVGEALVALGHVTPERLQRVVSEALGVAPQVAVSRPPLGELLVGLHHLSHAQLQQALDRQRGTHAKLGEILVEMGFCNYRQVYEALSLQSRMAGADGAAAPQHQPGRARVLVVDDSPLAVSLIEEGLVPRGYEVFTFTDPFEALEKVAKLDPDIVLSDLDMPGMTGAELCRRLKNGPSREIPVLILTANDSGRERVEGLRSGADDFVAKSASLDELGARIDGILRRTQETERVRKLFARYTSDAVVEEILKGGEVVLTGEKREVTLLFADIRNFTALAETLTPEAVVGLLNTVLGKLSEVVLMCGGTLDKFLGDGLMAVFGAPIRREDDALRALQAAKMMMDATAADPQMRLGIGINSGDVVVGNLGSQQRTEYTCIGDAVNVAARLCSVAGPGEVLVGSRTTELAGESQRFERLPPIRLKGKAQPVSVFRLAQPPELGQQKAS